MAPLPLIVTFDVKMVVGVGGSLAKALTPPNWSQVDIEDTKVTFVNKGQLCAIAKKKAKALKFEKGRE